MANNENDQQQDTDNDIDQQMEKSQMTDWDSEGDDNDQYERESETEVDNVNTTSSRNGSVIKRAKVEKVKPLVKKMSIMASCSISTPATDAIFPSTSLQSTIRSQSYLQVHPKHSQRG